MLNLYWKVFQNVYLFFFKTSLATFKHFNNVKQNWMLKGSLQKKKKNKLKSLKVAQVKDEMDDDEDEDDGCDSV